VSDQLVVETERASPVTMSAAWHEQTEWEIALAYSQGFAAGVEHARLAMDAGLSEAVDGASTSAKEIVQRLIRTMNQAAARAEMCSEPDMRGQSQVIALPTQTQSSGRIAA
jgi:hypothetical protein